jgi:phosphohistidine phosphatase
VKRLSLLRHASAAASPTDGNDFDRPLTPHGLAEASALGRHLRAAGESPGLLMASPALRTRQTAEALASELSLPPEHIALEPRLYLAEAEEILGVIREAPVETTHLVVVGHNPGLSQLASWLARSAGHAVFEPASGCTLAFQTSRWEEVAPGTARQVRRERASPSSSGS